LADQLRVEAVEALISQGGAADILRLARAVKNAGWVGRATMESSASDAIKAELIKTGLRSDDQREADLAYGIIIGGRVLRSPTWTDDLWDRATSEGWVHERLSAFSSPCPLTAQPGTGGCGGSRCGNSLLAASLSLFSPWFE